MYRISFGLVSIVLSLLLAARALDVAPDPDPVHVGKRVAVTEGLAVAYTVAAPTDAGAGDALVRSVLRRNPDALSAAVRDTSGRLIAAAGDHEQHWAGHDPQKSTPTHLHLPVTRHKQPCGRVEVCFRPLPYSGWWGYVGGPLAPMLGFVALAGFLATTRYLRAVFRRVELANSKMMPRRARDTLDALAEGVHVLNRQQEIVFANREFARAADIPREKLHGRKVLDLPWVVARTESVPDDYPWVKAVRESALQTGTILRLRVGERARPLSVNSCPIPDDDGTCRGALVTFDDLTPAENRNIRLRK
jgi:PAS domain-containing protein